MRFHKAWNEITRIVAALVSTCTMRRKQAGPTDSIVNYQVCGHSTKGGLHSPCRECNWFYVVKRQRIFPILITHQDLHQKQFWSMNFIASRNGYFQLPWYNYSTILTLEYQVYTKQNCLPCYIHFLLDIQRLTQLKQRR